MTCVFCDICVPTGSPSSSTRPSATGNPSPTRQSGGPATTSTLPDFSRFTAQKLEELITDQTAFKAVLREAIKGSPVGTAADPSGIGGVLRIAATGLQQCI